MLLILAAGVAPTIAALESPPAGKITLEEITSRLAARHHIALQTTVTAELSEIQRTPQLYAALTDVLVRFDALDLAGIAAIQHPSARTQEDYLATRDAFIQTSISFSQIAAATPSLPIRIVVPHLLDIDLTKEDTLHDIDVNLLIDTGGNDTYTNNAGGSYIAADKRYKCTYHDAYTANSALLDVSGDDLYDTNTCGAAGGAIRGTGLLIDIQGNDRYHAQLEGTNGGVKEFGYGLLIDVAGDDQYYGRSATNGGATSIGALIFNPYIIATGSLIDIQGNDTYVCGIYCNGGVSDLARGRLVDLQGDDKYSCSNSCNGGSFGEDSIGFLFDRHGNDTYKVNQSVGANGGAYGQSSWRLATAIDGKGVAEPTLAFLIDGGGHDTYIVDTAATYDETIIPKRTHSSSTWPHTIFGAQVDTSAPTIESLGATFAASGPEGAAMLAALQDIVARTDRTLAAISPALGTL